MRRGYYGIGIIGCKTRSNIGTLWRSAHLFDARFLVMIAPRYPWIKARQASDTTNARLHIPYFTFPDFDTFCAYGRPCDCALVAVEQTESSRDLPTFIHPHRAIYLLGAEDTGIPDYVLRVVQHTIAIPTPMCLNVAVAGSIVMYDRYVKSREQK